MKKEQLSGLHPAPSHVQHFFAISSYIYIYISEWYAFATFSQLIDFANIHWLTFMVAVNFTALNLFFFLPCLSSIDLL